MPAYLDNMSERYTSTLTVEPGEAEKAGATCEVCNSFHSGSYGSGRFCSSSCARKVGACTKWNKIRKAALQNLSGGLIKSPDGKLSPVKRLESPIKKSRTSMTREQIAALKKKCQSIAPKPASSCVVVVNGEQICEGCKMQHDGSYGSGRFCGPSCARRVAASMKWKRLRECDQSPTSRTVCDNNLRAMAAVISAAAAAVQNGPGSSTGGQFSPSQLSSPSLSDHHLHSHQTHHHPHVHAHSSHHTAHPPRSLPAALSSPTTPTAPTVSSYATGGAPSPRELSLLISSIKRSESVASFESQGSSFATAEDLDNANMLLALSGSAPGSPEPLPELPSPRSARANAMLYASADTSEPKPVMRHVMSDPSTTFPRPTHL